MSTGFMGGYGFIEVVVGTDPTVKGLTLKGGVSKETQFQVGGPSGFILWSN